VEDIRDKDEAEEEEGMVEAWDRLFVTTAGHQGTTRRRVKNTHSCHVNTAVSLTTL